MMGELFPEGGGTPDGEFEVPPEMAALFARIGSVPPSPEVTAKIIGELARIHGMWFTAWQADGGFSEAQAFELTRILVRAALRGTG